MDNNERVSQVHQQIRSRVDYCTKEYNVNLGEMVGILECIKMEMIIATRENNQQRGRDGGDH